MAVGEFGDGESHSDAVVCFTCSLRRQGTEEIEGIMLDLQEPEDMHLSSEVFKKVKRLRIVIIRKALFKDGFCKLISQIRKDGLNGLEVLYCQRHLHFMEENLLFSRCSIVSSSNLRDSRSYL